MTWKCPVCGAEVDDSVRFCPQCGTERGTGDTNNSQSAPAQQAQQEPQQVQTPPPAPANVPQAASSSSQLKLVYKKNGQITNQEFQIPEGSVIVGRFDPSTGPVDIDLAGLEESIYISRKHAELYKDATTNSWYVKDLGSSNGTYLNGTKLEANKPEELKKGDELSFGNMKFVVDL